MNIITLRVDWDWTQKYLLEILASMTGGSVGFLEELVIKFYYKYPSLETVKRMMRFANAKDAIYKLS
jgi:hypothetical protein